jgi:long-chain acyl-CoA synthetase
VPGPEPASIVVAVGGYPTTLVERADHPAVVCGGHARTYAQLHGRASRLARVLADEGVGRGDRLAVMLPNGVEFFECLAATAKLECASLTVNWHLAAEELAYVLTDADARALVAHRDLGGVVEAAAPRCPVLLVGEDGPDGYEARLAAADPAPLPYRWPTSWPVVYTSGTTGRPKGVVHGSLADREVMALTQTALSRMWGYTGDDVHLVAGPLYHAGPQGYANTTLFVGGTVVVMPTWDATGFCRLVETHRVTTSFLTPAHLIRLLELPEAERARHDLSSLRHVIHAGAPCPPPVKWRMMDAFPHVELWELYGMSEGGATRVSPEEWRERPGTVGRPWPGVEIRILDPVTRAPLPAGRDGLVYVKPAHGRFHYHGAQDKTDEAWLGDVFTVGDVGHLDEDGYLYLTDRAVDLVIKGGVNVYPREVEEVLHGHPAVVDCAVFGVPDERDGEHLRAVVELRDTGAPVTGSDLMAFCRARLDPWKCPDAVELVDRLPRDPNGKVLKRRLREQAWAGTGRRI